MSKTVKDLCNVFFNLEEQYELNHKKIQDVYPWQLVRVYLYYEIARKIGVFGAAQQQSLSLCDKIKSFLPFIKNSLLYNPFKGNYHKDFLIFDHPRKTIFQNEYKDIYSYFLVDYLKGNYSFEVIESPYLNKHFSKKENYIKFADRILLTSYFYKKFNKINFTDNEKEFINKIQNELENEFNISLDLFNIFSNHILNFKHDYKKYKKLFEKRKPKKVFIVVAYENKAVIAACKDLGIEVIELQHGTISNYHLGYAYPKKTQVLNGKIKEIKYFPNKILTFGDYWIDNSTSPIKSENVISIGFPYFEALTKNYLGNIKKDNQILFISQGVIGRYLSKFAYEVAKNLKDHEIIYKLHPGEYTTWIENYEYLNKAIKLNNFKVIDNSKVPLYDLFSKSKYQVGVFSTAIYEGLMFNCKTFIVNVSGVEYLEDLIKEAYLFKVNDPDELINNINTFKPKEYDKDFFFKNFNQKSLKKIIE